MQGKKILFFAPSLVGGGAERVTLNLAADWSRQGAEVMIATLSTDADAYTVPAGIRRIRLDAPNIASASLLSLLRNNISRGLFVYRVLRSEKPDIAVGMITISAVALALARGRDGIAIGMEHNYPPLQPLGRFREVLRRYCYARLDAVVALTTESAAWLRGHTKARLVSVIPNSVSLPLPESAPRLEVEHVTAPGRKCLLAAGRLHKQKGFDRLLDAFAQVAARHGDWDLVILGDGEMRGALETQAVRLGLGERVRLPGFAGNVADWYRAADAFVLTSRHEGFSLVLLEALAHGCPVISVDCDAGPRDFVRDGENGLLVAQNNPTALVAGLDRMLGDGKLRKRLAFRAAEVQERFSPERIRGMWEVLFDDLERDCDKNRNTRFKP